MKKLATYDSQFLVNVNDMLLFWGSCFTENISFFLKNGRFNTLSNSHGISFNPLSIQKAVNDCIENKNYDQGDLSKKDDVFFHYDFHGDFESLNEDDAIENMNFSILDFNKNMKSAKKSKVFITLGSAWYYERKDSGEVVANCHKIPQNEFNKKMMNPDEVSTCLKEIENSLNKILTDFQIILTVSPVRHKKDGWKENNLSKSSLLLGINNYINNSDKAFYLPVYEYVIDILRDYSFFEADGVHPNRKAIEQVEKEFCENMLDEYSQQFIKKMIALNSSLNHRIKLPGSKEHNKFLITLLDQIEKLQKDYPFLQLKSESTSVKRDLEKYFSK